MPDLQKQRALPSGQSTALAASPHVTDSAGSSSPLADVDSFLPQALICLRILEINQLGVSISERGDASAASAVLYQVLHLFAPCQTQQQRRAQGMFWFLKGRACMWGDGRNQLRKKT